MATLTPPLGTKRNDHSEELGHFEVLKQLDRIISSPHFRNSKRYPNLLKFVVEHTLAGRTDALKERTLGIEVFGRPTHYDTSADPVVRVTAGEIRKRIAQYYQADGHEHELRIDLPVGSYVPQFFFPDAAPEPVLSAGDESGTAAETRDPAFDSIPIHPPPEPSLEKGAVRARALSIGLAISFLLLGAVLSSATFLLYPRLGHPSGKGIDYLWQPITAAASPALIVIGVHSLDSSGKDLSPELHIPAQTTNKQNMLWAMIRSEMVPVSDIVSYSQITKLLTERGHPFRTQGASATTFEQLQRGPVILVGGFDNVWTLRSASSMRYRFDNPGALLGVIFDSEHPETRWSFDNGQSAVGDSRDYAIVARFFDPRIEQPVLIAAGIGKSGTAAAAEFLTDRKYLDTWMAQTKAAKGKNVEIVLSTEIIEGQQGPPQIIASHIW